MNNITRLLLAAVVLWLLFVIGAWTLRLLFTLTIVALRIGLGLVFVIMVVGVIAWFGRQFRGV